jgi:hypothetical protein
MDEPKQSESPAEPAYSYKPSLMGSPWTLRLTPDHLSWNRGHGSGRIAYRDITRIRLSFRPVTMQTRRYLTEIWAPGAPKLTIASASWKSIMEQESLHKPYAEFVLQLHRRVAASGGRPQCESGLNPFLYWPGVIVYVAVLLALAGLIVRALQVSSYPGALFVGAFMAVFAWQLGHFFKLNKPVRYSPDAPPQNLLPIS